jgi:glycosyltransferase involved in cell wall biosynthesis
MSASAEAEHAAGRRIRVLHVISGLGVGGAETFLLRLAVALSGAAESRIATLSRGGGMAPRFQQAGLDVYELALAGGSGMLRLPSAGSRLVGEVRAWRPQIIQGWLNHGNVAALFVQRVFSRNSKVIWCMRQSFDAVVREKPGTRVMIGLQGRLASWPDAVIFNSARSQRQFVELSGTARELKLIPNGFDTLKFAPNADLRRSARALMGARDGEFVVAMVARDHPMKDYHCFMEAIARASRLVPHIRAVCIGRGVTSDQSSIRPLIGKWHIEDRCTLLSERADLEQVYPGVDLLCLTSSWGEGFPNVLGEAMACGVPCVATDVGDAAAIVGDTGFLVRPGRPQEVAERIVAYSSLDRETRARLGGTARRRIDQMYSVSAIAAKYMEVYKELLDFT